MTSFKSLADYSSSSYSSSSSSSSSSLNVKKYILLMKYDLTNETDSNAYKLAVSEFKKMNIAIHKFDYDTEAKRTLNDILNTCEMLIINLKDDNSRRWYNSYADSAKNGGDNLVIIFIAKEKKPISDVGKIKESYFADYVRKGVVKSEDAIDKVDYLVKLAVDHMPKIQSLCEKITGFFGKN